MRLLLPFIIFILLLFRMRMRNTDRSQKNRDQLFWERESEANTVRKKDIEHLHYITIPENLPPIDTDNSKILDLLAKLEAMRDKKIVNLTGISNTDLKLTYGVANLTPLSEYDENFTSLARIIANLGHALLEEGFMEEAIFFLQWGIDCKTDISSNYLDLAQIYHQRNQSEKIVELIAAAEELHSLSKDVIMKKLQDI